MATHEPVGSLAEEAAKLFSALQGWASERRAAPDSGSRAGTSDGGSAAGTSDGGSAAGTSDGGSAAGTSDGGSAAGTSDGGSAAGTSEAGRDDAARYADEHAAGQHLSAECRYCPVCNVARFARAASPEVREHLTSAALSMTLAVKGLLEGLDQGNRPEPRRDPVEKIDLLED